eukprot:SAG31_NODE_1319_length_8817_cov_1.857077_3_plen_291_part_00
MSDRSWSQALRARLECEGDNGRDGRDGHGDERAGGGLWQRALRQPVPCPGLLELGALQSVARRILGHARDVDDVAAGRIGRDEARFAVLVRAALGRVDADALRCLEVHVRRGLTLGDLGGADDVVLCRVEQVVEAGVVQVVDDVVAQPARRDGARDTRGDRLARNLHHARDRRWMAKFALVRLVVVLLGGQECVYLLLRGLAALLAAVERLDNVGQRLACVAIEVVHRHRQSKVRAHVRPRLEEQWHRVDQRAVNVKQQAFQVLPRDEFWPDGGLPAGQRSSHLIRVSAD